MKNKTFDAVAWMRKRREKIDEEDQGLSWEHRHKKTRQLIENDLLWLRLKETGCKAERVSVCCFRGVEEEVWPQADKVGGRSKGKLARDHLSLPRDAHGDKDIQMKIKNRSQSPLKKKTRRGFRGYPVATVAFYGPDNTRATKVAVGIVPGEGAEPEVLERWFAEEGDVRTDREIGREILDFIERHSVKSVVMTDRIIGCPHEEGVDYPMGQACPQCPFWSYRDRWTGDALH